MAVSLGPRSMTQRVKNEILRGVQHGLPMTKAVWLAGIHYSTWRAWVVEAEDGWERGVSNEYTEFIGQVRQAEAEFALEKLDDVSRAGKRSWTAAAWLLERRFPQDFGTKQSLEISGPEGGPIVTINDEALKDLSTDELLVLQSALQKLNGANNGNRALGSPTQTVDAVPTQARSDPS